MTEAQFHERVLAQMEAQTALLRELNADGCTLVVVTHDPRYLREARRTVYLYDGRLVPGAPQGLEVA